MAFDHRGVRAWHVLASVLAIGAAACAGILGIDDRQLDTSDGGSMQGDGGPTPDGPSNGDGPATGDGPSSGDGPSQSDTGTVDASSCDGGPCVLATGLDYPFLMASDSNNVYWTEFGDSQGAGNGSVKGCPLAGCGSGPTVYATALTNPRGIVSDGTNVYFGTATYAAVNGAIWSCAVGGCGGNPTKLSDAAIPYGLTVDSTYVYWADYNDGTVNRVPKTGAGGGTVLYDGGGAATESEAIASDTSFAYFTDYNGDVYKVSIGGGDPTQMASWSQGGPGWPVKVDSTWVYYGQPGGVAAMSKNAIDGGAFIVSNLQDPLGIELDPPTGRLYWADYGLTGTDGTIGRVGTDGGGRLLIASSQVNVEAVTVSGNYVFWISNGVVNDDAGNPLPNTGELLRMPK